MGNYTCDCPDCRLPALVEVYYSDDDNSRYPTAWSLLCLRHFILARHYKHRIGYCLVWWLCKIPIIPSLIEKVLFYESKKSIEERLERLKGLPPSPASLEYVPLK